MGMLAKTEFDGCFLSQRKGALIAKTMTYIDVYFPLFLIWSALVAF